MALTTARANWAAAGATHRVGDTRKSRWQCRTCMQPAALSRRTPLPPSPSPAHTPARSRSPRPAPPAAASGLPGPGPGRPPGHCSGTTPHPCVAYPWPWCAGPAQPGGAESGAAPATGLLSTRVYGGWVCLAPLRRWRWPRPTRR
jgi:hypothetical protein